MKDKSKPVRVVGRKMKLNNGEADIKDTPFEQPHINFTVF